MTLAVEVARLAGAKLAGKLDHVDTKLTLTEFLEDTAIYARTERQKIIERLKKDKKKKA